MSLSKKIKGFTQKALSFSVIFYMNIYVYINEKLINLYYELQLKNKNEVLHYSAQKNLAMLSEWSLCKHA